MTTANITDVFDSGFAFFLANVRGYRAKAGFHMDFGNVISLYGRSGAGKSTFTGNIKFFRAFTDTGSSAFDTVILGNDRRDREDEGGFKQRRWKSENLPANVAQNIYIEDKSAPAVMSLWYFNSEYTVSYDLSGDAPVIIEEKIVQYPTAETPMVRGKPAQPVVLLHRVGSSLSYLALGKNELIEAERVYKSAARDYTQKYERKLGEDNPIIGIVHAIHNFNVVGDLDLHNLRQNGSRQDHSYHFNSRGHNTFTMASLWVGDRKHSARLDWVKATMRELFPERFYSVEFPRKGEQVSAAFYPTKEANDLNQSIHPKFISDGILQAFILLVAVAEAKSGSVVAIDDIDVKIDPEVLPIFLKAIITKAQEMEVMLIVTTSSMVVASFVDSMSKENGRVHSLGIYAKGNDVVIEALRRQGEKPVGVKAVSNESGDETGSKTVSGKKAKVEKSTAE